MKARHTPGPWRVTDEGHGLEVETKRSPRPGDIIAKLRGGDQTRRFSDAEVAANARLMAAAPDLLDACHRATEELEKKVRDPYVESDEVTWLIDMQEILGDAIAKAEGAE